MSDAEKHWPAFKLDLNLLAGAMEVGCDLHVTGLFGGFGGSLWSVHRTEGEAVQYAKDHPMSGGTMIFKIKVENTGIYIGPKGEEIRPKQEHIAKP